MKKIDLHIHTVKSISDADFNFSLIRLQEYVNAMNLDCIAITNHNLFDITQFREITTLLNNIVVFPGIEINLCGGHLLLISDSSNLEEFSKRADCVKNKITLATDSLSYEEFINIYPDYEKYLLIPHYDKTPSLSFETIKLFGDNIFTGEVSSPKKFIYAIKRNEIVPVLFSDCRLEALTTFSSKQTFLDIGDITLRALKAALHDKNKVSLTEEGGHDLISINNGEIKISTGLNVILGKRSSGKTYTLNLLDLKSATKLFSVLLASKRPLITELADKLRLKYPLLHTRNNRAGHLQPGQEPIFQRVQPAVTGKNRIFGEKLPATCQKGGGGYTGRHQTNRIANGNGKDHSSHDTVQLGL